MSRVSEHHLAFHFHFLANVRPQQDLPHVLLQFWYQCLLLLLCSGLTGSTFLRFLFLAGSEVLAWLDYLHVNASMDQILAKGHGASQVF